MNLSKGHPCNSLGWLYVEQNIAQQAMQQQLRMVADELAKDRSFSGEPPAFKAWAVNQIQAIADQPAIAAQIAKRRDHLHQELVRAELELASAVEHHLKRTEQLNADLDLLDQLQ